MFGVVMGLVLICNSCFTFPISNDTIPSKSHLVLPEINLKGNTMVAKRRGDTLVFTADRYKRADAIRLEQLLNNVPGFYVDGNGRISFNGKPVQKLMLDGDDLTAENYQLISRNLRSLLIDSIQVLEKYNENRLLKSLHDNKGIAINLVLKPSYYGRSNVNLLAIYAPKKRGELQSEVIHLRKLIKQFVLVNANNLGNYPLQSQLIEQSHENVKQEVLFHSWPLVLQNISIGSLANRYINQNGDWGIAYAGITKVNPHNQIRFNLKKSNQTIVQQIEQDQLFSYTDDLAITMYALNAEKRKYNSTNGAIDWERDKGDKRIAKIQFKFYHDINQVNSNEYREIIKSSKILSNSNLLSKGVAFSITQTWKPKLNYVLIWESDVELSNNKYGIMIYRNHFLDHDSLQTMIRQLVNHSGANARSSIGYFTNRKEVNFKFWLKSSFSTINSKQDLRLLHLTVFKNYLSTQITSAISKKLNLEIQSMIGRFDYRINAQQRFRMMYHLDYAIVWKRKATQQFSFTGGVLRQGVEARKLFVGEIYLNGSSLVKGPTDLSFPLSIYSQLNFSIFNLYSGLTFGAQLLINRVIGDYFMSVELDPFFTKMSELQNGSKLTQSLNLHFEKVIHPIRLKYRTQISTMRLKNLSQFDDQQFYATNLVSRFSNSLVTNWRKGYNIQFEYNHIRSKFNRMKEKYAFWSIRHEYKTTFQIQFNRQLNANIALIRYSGKGILSLDLFDFSINWIFNRKHRFYMQGFNLLNSKYFVEQVIHANSISTSKQQLIGRRVGIGIDMPL